MTKVKIGDLKARLSAHLKVVRNGGQVLVYDRDQPIARIVPYRADDYAEEMQDLIALGVITPPLKPRIASVKPPKPTAKIIPQDVIEKILEEEREGR